MKDVQFSPYSLGYFAFASADDGGNIHVSKIEQAHKNKNYSCLQ